MYKVRPQKAFYSIILSFSLFSGSLFTGCQSENDRNELFLYLLILQAISSNNAVSLSESESEFVRLVNNHRTSNAGCTALENHGPLTTVARNHSQDMNNRNFFAHDNPDGLSPFDRMSNAGITYSSAGENIARGYSTADAVLTGWLNSSGHRRNIENCNYTHHGIGHVEDGNYWTHVFARNPN